MSQPSEINAVRPKIPDFWTGAPEAWIASVEAQFEISKITATNLVDLAPVHAKREWKEGASHYEGIEEFGSTLKTHLESATCSSRGWVDLVDKWNATVGNCSQFLEFKPTSGWSYKEVYHLDLTIFCICGAHNSQFFTGAPMMDCLDKCTVLGIIGKSGGVYDNLEGRH